MILTINCGSSSLKYSVYNTKKKLIIVRGIIERIGTEDSIHRYTVASSEKFFKIKIPSHKVAIKLLLEFLISPTEGVINQIRVIKAVGHRIVHGGEKFVKATIITEDVEKEIEKLIPLAPLHNPANLSGVRTCRELLPNIPHIAIFDTTFHAYLPECAFRYAIPKEWYLEKQVRRYGFHGTSHEYVSKRAIEIMGSPSRSKLISLHLGNGSSITAIKDGKSIDTSMGFTPLEGLIMGTRSGDLDPGIIFYMIREGNLKPTEVDEILNKKSGLIGITADHSDMRDIEEKIQSEDKAAKLALDMVIHRIKKYIGAYYVALEGLDAMIFTAGIGENSSTLRRKICENLLFMGVEIDQRENERATGGKEEVVISTPSSKVKIFVIPTNEEKMMSMEVEKLLLEL